MVDTGYEEIVKEFLNNGEQLYNNGYYNELVNLCHNFLKNLNDDRVYSLLTNAEFALGDITSAEKSARKGIYINPDNPDHKLNLAYILYQKGMFSSAMRYFYLAGKIYTAGAADLCKQEIAKLLEITGKSVKEVFPPKSNKRVLIIAAIYPPESGSGVQRTVKLVKYLRLFGWEPVVITLPINEKPDFSGFEYFDELPDNIEIIRVPVKVEVSVSDISNMKNLLMTMVSPKTRDEFEKNYNNSDWRVKLNLCSFPDSLALWAYDAASTIEKYIDMNKIDLIYSTSGPYCDHFAAYQLKERYQKPWVADFRDEWSNNPAIWPNKDNLSFRMCLDCERVIINNAEVVICVTEKSLDNYLKMGFPSSKLFCITNGFDEEDFEGIIDSSHKNEKFTLIHNGLLYLDRSPKTILEALRNLLKNGQIDERKIVFHMGTYANNVENIGLKAEVKQMGLENIAVVSSYMEHRESLMHAASANLLILILGPSDNYSATYPAKIFEYLRLGKPILSLGPRESVVDGLLERFGCGVNIVFNDVAYIENEILKRYHMWLGKEEYNPINIDKTTSYERRNLTAKHAGIFELAVSDYIKVNGVGSISTQNNNVEITRSDNMKNIDKITEAYNGNLGKDLMEASKRRIHWICSQAKGESILDVGCSQGIVSIILGREGKHTVGIDICQENIDYANKSLENEESIIKSYVEFKCIDFIGYINKFNEQFDCIIMGEIIEHLTEPERFIALAYKHLMEMGLIIITVPFGINDYHDHKKTYYLTGLYQLIKHSFMVYDIVFFGNWIGMVGCKCAENGIILDDELFAKAETAFYNHEKYLQRQIHALSNELINRNSLLYETVKQKKTTQTSVKMS